MAHNRKGILRNFNNTTENELLSIKSFLKNKNRAISLTLYNVSTLKRKENVFAMSAFFKFLGGQMGNKKRN